MFDARRVLALESRRSAELAELIRRQGGDPFVAPSMREIPLESDDATARFAERLYAGEFDMMVLLTGVGTRQLNRLLGPRFGEALRKLTLVARGPKPVAALREMGLTAAVVAPEPNTWRELLQAIEGRPEKRIAVQEYGRSNPELLAGLRGRGAEVTAARVSVGSAGGHGAAVRGRAAIGGWRVRCRALHHCDPGIAFGAGSTPARNRGCRHGGAAAVLRGIDRADHHRGSGRVRDLPGLRTVAS